VIAGRYTFEREIGRGGSGAVWLGRDRTLGRDVALKRIGLLPGADETDHARAEREARLTARLNHPHVVSVFDVVPDDKTGTPWLVMEYVDGMNLGQLIKQRGKLSIEEAAPLLWQVADALVAAHDAGIAHRDVKPANILVDHEGLAKLTDFGIARVDADPSLTQTGMVTGSPSYLAPEIASGGRGDTASDVWSLGATIFHVLAGHPPYEAGDNLLGTLYRIVHDDPPRLEGAGRMKVLLDNTMVKDPARRWSMEQVRDFLSGVAATGVPLAHEPLIPHELRDRSEDTQRIDRPVQPSSTPPVAAAPARHAEREHHGHSRTVLMVAGGVLGALLVALVLVLYLDSDEPSTKATSGSDKGTTNAPTAPPSDKAPAQPTAAGMEKFIDDYVQTVSDDPDQAWQMLTPKFQRESGGLDTYRDFWEDASNGRVLEFSADPKSLSVSYKVHFDNFDNGPGPTVLDLKFDDGRYWIDGERTEGFVPAE
jgi:serine/threonine protein kinase